MQSLVDHASVGHLVAFGCVLVLLSGWYILTWIRVYWTPFLNLPAAENFLHGSLGCLTADAGPVGKITEQWFDKYGSTLLLRSSGLRPQILTRDVSVIRAVSHSSGGYIAPAASASVRSLRLDHCLVASLNDEHRRQRKILNPLFSTTAMRQLWPDMVAKCRLVREWLEIQGEGGSYSTYAKDILRPLSIGLIGKCLYGEDREVIMGAELKDFEKVMFKTQVLKVSWLDMIGCDRFFRTFPISQRQKREACLAAGLRTVSKEILMRAEADLKSKEKDGFGDHHILSKLLRATWATDVPDNKRLSQRQLEDNLTMLFFAGHSTVVDTLEWALHYAASYKDVQEKLRKELCGLDEDADFDQVNQLPYLDAFLREVLRCHAIGSIIQREALEAFTIPLSEPVRGRDGQMMDVITVDKGTNILWSVWDVNYRSSVYGEDHRMFRPERHFQGEHNIGLGAVWGNVATFSGGDHACIGFRFAVAEMKAVFFTFLRSLEILEPQGQKVTFHGMMFSRKTLSQSDGKTTLGIPIIVRSLKRSPE